MEKILKKIKQFLNDRHYAFIDDEQEFARYIEEQGLWNNPKDKSYWSRTDWSDKGHDTKKQCKKLDLMNGK